MPVRFLPSRWMGRLLLALAALALVGAGLWLLTGHRAGQHAAQEPLRCAIPAPAAPEPHPGMAWVPGGSFEFGDTIYAEETPVRRVQVAGFWMDRTEVTNDAFAAFVKATGYVTTAEREVDPQRHPGLPPAMRQPGAVVFTMPNAVNGRGDITQWWRYLPGASWKHPGGPDTSIEDRGAFPVVAVSLEDAQAYARWKGHELPREAEWEWAARAGEARAAQDHGQPQQANTWQGLFPVANSAQDGFVGVAPAGCYAANRLGLFDMIGNVWEWTADVYTPFHQDPVSPADVLPPVMARTPAMQQRVIKGGSFLCAPNYCMRYRSGARQPQDEDLGASHLGFRTVLRAPDP